MSVWLRPYVKWGSINRPNESWGVMHTTWGRRQRRVGGSKVLDYFHEVLD